MDIIFNLKLMADLLKGKTVSPDKLDCAKTILSQLIKNYDIKNVEPYYRESTLDPQAQDAKNDLIG